MNKRIDNLEICPLCWLRGDEIEVFKDSKGGFQCGGCGQYYKNMGTLALNCMKAQRRYAEKEKREAKQKERLSKEKKQRDAIGKLG